MKFLTLSLSLFPFPFCPPSRWERRKAIQLFNTLSEERRERMSNPACKQAARELGFCMEKSECMKNGKTLLECLKDPKEIGDCEVSFER